MEYLIATLLFCCFALILWSRNNQSSSHHFTQNPQQLERIERLLQEIQNDQRFGQNSLISKIQLDRIEEKIDRILQEFNITDSYSNDLPKISHQTEFTLLLNHVPGDKKIAIIKEVRSLTGLGLKETKDLIESPLPVVIKQGLSESEAEKAQTLLEKAGAQVTLR